MTITYDDYAELPGSPVETLDAKTGTLKATRSFVCDWLKRYDLRDYFFEYGQREYSYVANMFAVSCEMEPYLVTPSSREGAGTDRVLYDKAKLTVQYESLVAQTANPGDTGNVTGCDLYEEQLDTEIQYLMVPSGTLYWDSSQLEAIDEGQSPQKLVPYLNYNVTFHNATTIPSSFYTLVGTVNIANRVDLLTTVNLPGSLLYQGFSASRAMNYFGTAGWDISCKISRIMNESSNGWNKFWNPDEQEWGTLYDDSGTSVKIYDEADWSDLGIPPTPSP